MKSLREMISLLLLIFHNYVVKGQLTLNDLNTKLKNLETKVSSLEHEVKVSLNLWFLFDSSKMDELTRHLRY